jgi:hypothetical protein
MMKTIYFAQAISKIQSTLPIIIMSFIEFKSTTTIFNTVC